MACNSSPELVTVEGVNRTDIKCQRCGSVILKTGAAKFKSKEIFLPFMKKKSEEQKPEDGETLEKHWVVDNMFAFENVGFSHTVGTIKYLTCADCEIGPVGWHDTTNTVEFFITMDRVEHSS